MASTSVISRNSMPWDMCIIASQIALSMALFVIKRTKVGNKVKCDKEVTSQSSLLFLGSGSSTGTPFLACVLGLVPRTAGGKCITCKNAMEAMNANTFDRTSEEYKQMVNSDAYKDLRGNPSLLIRYMPETVNESDNGNDANEKRIVIDVGKTFLQSALRFFPQHNINGIDGVIISHEHADAFHGGLDELRTVQRLKNLDPNTVLSPDSHWLAQQLAPIDVYASEKCMPIVKNVYKYLFPKTEEALKNPNRIQRYVAQVSFHTYPLELTGKFNCCGLDFTPLPVLHGRDFLSSGFAFGKDDWVVYISDVSEIPNATMEWIKNERDKRKDGIALLVLDCLRMKQIPSIPIVHFSFDEACECALELKPKKTLLLGMSHEICHAEAMVQCSEFYKKTGVDIEFAYDGLELKGLRL